MKKFRVDIETRRGHGIMREFETETWQDALEEAFSYIEQLRQVNGIDRTCMYPDAYQVYDIEQKKIVWDYFNGELK